MKNYKVALVGILFLSFVLRIIAINQREIIYDDAFTVLLSEKKLSQIITGTAADTMPPLFYFILHFWMVITQRLVWLRLINVIVSLVTITITYSWVTRVFSNVEAALYTVLLMAISPWQIYHAQDIRMYALLALFLSGYAYYTSITFLLPDQQKLINWVGIIVTCAGALYTHNLAIFTLVAPNIYLTMRKDWHGLKRLIILQIVTGLLFFPWLVRVPGQLEKIQTAFWTPKPGVTEVLQAMIYFVGSLPLPPFSLIVVLFITLMIFGILVYEGITLIREIPNSYYLLIFIVSPPLILFVFSYIIRPIFVPRGFLYSSVAFNVLCGLVIANLKSTLKRALLIALFISAATISLLYQIPYNEFPRSPYRKALNYAKEKINNGTIVVHDNKLSYLPMYYYDRDFNQVFIRDQPGTFNDTLAINTQEVLGIPSIKSISEVAGKYQEIYYIFFSQMEHEYQVAGAVNPNLSWLKGNCLLTHTEKFRDLWVQEYECIG